MRTYFTIVVLVLIALVSAFVSLAVWWLGLVLYLVLAGVFIKNGLRKIPADPPYKGVLRLFGKRVEVILDEGWNWLPIYPFAFGYVPVKVVKVNYDLPPQQVRTPDKAVISILASVTWMPGINGKPGSYITYLNSGGEEGVKKILHDMIEDRVKTWAGSDREGPSDWMEAQTMKDEAHWVLTKTLLRSALPPIDSPIPTVTWMRFLDKPKAEPTQYDARPQNGWAVKDKTAGTWNWNGLNTIFLGLSSNEKTVLEDAIKERRRAVRELREGNGKFEDESLGITILRFSVNDVKVEGEVARSAELEEKERREKAADTMEIGNVSERVRQLKRDHPDLPVEKAFEIVQTERRKVGKTIIAISGAQTGLGQDLLGLGGLFRGIAETLKSNQSGEQGKRGGGPSGNRDGKSKRIKDLTEEERQAALDKINRGES